MIDPQTKQVFIKTIKDTGVDHPITDVMEVFINNYEGTNEKYLKILCLSVTGLLLSYKEILIKAQAYDQVSGVQDEVKRELDEMKEVFEDVNSGLLPPEPAVENLD